MKNLPLKYPIFDTNTEKHDVEEFSKSGRRTGGFAILWCNAHTSPDSMQDCFVMFEGYKGRGLEFPGGKREEIDSNLYEQIAREVREETCNYIPMRASYLQNFPGRYILDNSSYYSTVKIQNPNNNDFKSRIKYEQKTKHRKNYQEMSNLYKIPITEFSGTIEPNKYICVRDIFGNKHKVWRVAAIAAFHALKNGDLDHMKCTQ